MIGQKIGLPMGWRAGELGEKEESRLIRLEGGVCVHLDRGPMEDFADVEKQQAGDAVRDGGCGVNQPACPCNQKAELVEAKERKRGGGLRKMRKH